MFPMPGLRASGVCLLLAGIAGLFLTQDGLRQYHSLVSGTTAPPDRSDIIWLLQAKGEVEVARVKEEIDQHMSSDLSGVQHMSVDQSRLGAKMPNTDVPAKSPPLVASADPHAVRAAGPHDSEEPSPQMRVGLVSLEMWRTTAIRYWQSNMMESFMSIVPSICACIFLGLFVAYWCLLEHLVHRDKDLTNIPFEERAPETTSRFPDDEKNSDPATPRTEQMSEVRLMVPVKALRQAAANALFESSEVMIDSTLGQARLPLHVIISKVIGGSRIEVLTSTARSVTQVTIEPPPNMSGAKGSSLDIRGSHVTSSGETTPTFVGTLEEDSVGRHVVLQDCCPIMFLRGGLDPKSLALTTPRGELLASVYESCDSASSAKHQLEMRIDEGADTPLVLACALAVAIRRFS